MSVEFIRGERLSDEDDSFVKREWAAIEGEGTAMSKSAAVAIVAKDGDETVGALRGWHTGNVGYINELIVKAERRGQGIGANLLAQFEQECLANGAHRLAFRVEAESPARALYEREGWRVELTVEDWLGGHTYLQMRKDL